MAAKLLLCFSVLYYAIFASCRAQLCTPTVYARLRGIIGDHVSNDTAFTEDSALDACRDVREAMGRLINLAITCLPLEMGHRQVGTHIRLARNYLAVRCEAVGGAQAMWHRSACYRRYLPETCVLGGDGDGMVQYEVAPMTAQCGYYAQFTHCVIGVIKKHCRGEDKHYVLTYLLDEAQKLAFSCPKVRLPHSVEVFQMFYHGIDNVVDQMLDDEFLADDKSCVGKTLADCLESVGDQPYWKETLTRHEENAPSLCRVVGSCMKRLSKEYDECSGKDEFERIAKKWKKQHQDLYSCLINETVPEYLLPSSSLPKPPVSSAKGMVVITTTTTTAVPTTEVITTTTAATTTPVIVTTPFVTTTTVPTPETTVIPPVPSLKTASSCGVLVEASYSMLVGYVIAYVLSI